VEILAVEGCKSFEFLLKTKIPNQKFRLIVPFSPVKGAAGGTAPDAQHFRQFY